ncbi:tRNA pseudouridine(13) synthase TruD [Ferrimonas aestuarii]|uniref:tRNA pseudouridine synthase D n=1 Tax=Ferrimonas aestuarii TaxID=2569539 RepID=A0A4U1BT32_9GAMM|nr:tRNA pseudouridine(13) synthase TruD [Ferrimonas aestuarii]TKB55435.1 tRNA pseudouridine(13) synthase TruD [Ferrimonas aestuarii]
MSEYQLPTWHYLHGKPSATAQLRTLPEDFQVDELIPFSADGQGEHHLIHIKKRLLTTHQVAKQLAAFAGVKSMDVSWAGLKDKYGVTTQWFSVRIPGKETPDWHSLNDENLQVLEALRHSRKLRTGALSGNRFTLTLREVSDRESVDARLERIAEQGVPNYFGEQRFGHGGRNVERAAEMFGGRRVKDRNKRSIYLSAARSFLFNQIASMRLEQHGTALLPGDTLMFATGNSQFKSEVDDASILARYQAGELRLTAPLAGSYQSQGDAADEFEQNGLSQWPELVSGLANARIAQERRSLLLKPQGLKWHWQDNHLVLSFLLPPGSYATAVLRELLDYKDMQAFENQSIEK